jgi:hypothetical protein
MELMQSGDAAVNTVRGMAPGSKVDNMSRNFKEKIFAASIEGQLTRGDSAGALARLTEKDDKGNVVAAKYLGGSRYVSLLNEAQSRAAHASAFQTSQAQSEIQDNLALIEDGKTPRANFNIVEVAQRLSGGKQDKFDAVHKALATQVEGAYYTAYGRDQLRGKSEGDRNRILAEMAADPTKVPYQGRLPADGKDPVTGASLNLLGYDDAQKLHHNLAAWNKADQAAMLSDSSAYFKANNKEVQKAYVVAGEAAQAAQKAQLQSPKDAPRLAELAQGAFQSALKSNLLAQEKAGIPYGDQQVLDLSLAKKTAGEIMNGDVNQVEQIFGQMSKEYGPYYTKALQAMTSRQLKEEDRLSPIYEEIGNSLGSGSNRLLISALRELKKDPGAFSKIYPTETEASAAKTALYADKNVQKYMAATTLNGQGALDFDRKMDAVQIIQKQLYRAGGGKSVSDAAKGAIKMKFTDEYNFIELDGRIVMTPTQDSKGRPIKKPGMFGASPMNTDGGSVNDIQFNLENRKEYYGNKPVEYFDPSHVAALPSTLSSEAKTKLFNYNLKNKSFWKTTEDKRGVELWMEVGGPGTAFRVKLKSGQPIFHDFDGLAWQSFAPNLNPNDVKKMSQ